MEEDLQKAKGSAASQSEMVASLEERLEQAKAAENEARERFTELQEQLKKSTVSEEDANKIKELEKELEVLRAQKKELAETKSKLESAEKDMLTCKKQLENAAKELADRDSELAASRTELAKVQGAEEELKKKVASLEEALTKANNDLGKSEVCGQEYKNYKNLMHELESWKSFLLMQYQKLQSHVPMINIDSFKIEIGDQFKEHKLNYHFPKVAVVESPGV